jgi:hypothetical protein
VYTSTPVNTDIGMHCVYLYWELFLGVLDVSYDWLHNRILVLHMYSNTLITPFNQYIPFGFNRI